MGGMFLMSYSIRKTVVAAVAALGMATAVASMPTPAEAQFHGGGGFHGGGFHGGWGGGGFHGGGGWHGGWGRPGGGGGGWGWGRPRGGGGCGARGGEAGGGAGGWAGAGGGVGVGGVVGAGAGIRAGRSQPPRCRSGSQSRRSLRMTADPVAGRGGASGRRTATILAGGS